MGKGHSRLARLRADDPPVPLSIKLLVPHVGRAPVGYWLAGEVGSHIKCGMPSDGVQASARNGLGKMGVLPQRCTRLPFIISVSLACHRTMCKPAN